MPSSDFLPQKIEKILPYKNGVCPTPAHQTIEKSLTSSDLPPQKLETTSSNKKGDCLTPAYQNY